MEPQKGTLAALDEARRDRFRELGRKGGLARAARLEQWRRREIATMGGHATAEKTGELFATSSLSCTPWKRLRPIRGDPAEYIQRRWSRRIPKAYEEVLNATMRGEPVRPIVLVVLKTMTAMCGSALSAEGRQVADGRPAIDFRQLDNETLMKLAGMRGNAHRPKQER